jgi:hypothetical protein
MPWDDELARLMTYVQKRLGEDALNGAVTAAMRAVMNGQPSTVVVSAEGVEDAVEAFSIDALIEALRAELRRVARPN